MNHKVHRAHEETELSENEFETALHTVYEGLDPNLKAMVSWEYYLDQAKQNKSKFEPTLKAANATAAPLPEATYYGKVGCLRVFESIQLENLWTKYAHHHQGVAVELDVTHDFFADTQCENGPQIFQPVAYDDLRPRLPTRAEPFPALLSRPEHLAHEKEWRLIRPLKTSMMDENMKCPKAVLKGIYLGLNCPAPIAEEMAKLVKMDLQFRHVELHQMAVSETHLRLQPLNLQNYL